MNRRRRITFLFVILAALLAGPITAEACECPNTDDTVLGKFEKARFVVVARVVSVEKVPEVKTTYSGNKETHDVEAVVECELTGSVTLNGNQFKDCPQVVALLTEKGDVDWLTKTTDGIKIQTQNDVDSVELKLPFPSCNGAKIISRVRID